MARRKDEDEPINIDITVEQFFEIALEQSMENMKMYEQMIPMFKLMGLDLEEMKSLAQRDIDNARIGLENARKAAEE